MAALGQDHGAGEGFVAPVAAHEAVRHVPVGDILAVLHRDDLADGARVEHLVQLAPEGRVTQHVADLQDASGAFRCLHQFDTALQRVGHRFFQQHVVAGVHGRHRRLYVHLILRGDDGGAAKLTGVDQIFPRRKALAVVQIVLLGEAPAPDLVRLSHADNAHLLRVAQGIRGIRIRAATAGADHDKFLR